MYQPGRGLWLIVVTLAACGRSAAPLGPYAVGTFVGGGSVLVGHDDCTYEGGPGVFMPAGSVSTPSATPVNGPRFITGPGRIVVRCGTSTIEAEAVAPTAAVISGPAKVKVGARSEVFAAHLVAGSRTLVGDGTVEWRLAGTCAGIAEFAPVLGAQDTGGADRTRALVAEKVGSCQVSATITTGSSLYPGFPPKAFEADTLVIAE